MNACSEMKAFSRAQKKRAPKRPPFVPIGCRDQAMPGLVLGVGCAGL
jgi:hypothetical protein